MDIKQLKIIQQNFLQELKDARLGRKTSLPFIIHDLSPSLIVQDGETFQAMVIGGTVGKVAILKKTKDEIRILEKKNKKLEFKKEEDFLSFIDRELVDGVDTLALNFAYPIKPVFEKGRLDGVLLAVTKEGSFDGLVGKRIGIEIEKYISEKRKKKSRQNIPRGKFCQRLRTSVANDTICLLLSGLIRYQYQNLAAGIIGTGLNFAFFLDKNRLVDLESHNFNKFEQSKEGKLIDQQSAKPGTSLFEKEIAGAYLYKHFNIIIKDRKIDFPPVNSTEELNRISLNQYYSSSDQAKPESREVLKENSSRQARTIRNSEVPQIARDLLSTSAQLVACQIAGILLLRQAQDQNDKEIGEMVFNMEGSLFWKDNNYKETVQKTVKLLVPKYKVKFVEIEDSSILGAAKLVA